MIKFKIEHPFYESFKLILLFFFILINISCRPDDEDQEEPPRDYLVQSLDDDERLVQYLKSLYYQQ